jgi:hypothetical protein
MANQIVRPLNRKEFMSKLVGPAYDPKEGEVPVPFSEPAKLGQPEQNRAYEISVKGDTEKDFYIGIKDIDEAVFYYFNNVLKLSVIQNNTRVNLPILYGTPENWKTVQRDGYYRDENGKLMAPLLMFKRNSITQNRDLGYKLDGNLVHNLQTFETRFNKRNFYSNFNVLNSRAPEKKYIVSVTPDYITVQYECIVWTYFIEQMDKLIESLNFASRSYWGDPNRFHFLTTIDSFQDSVTYPIGDNRAVKTNFTMTLNGYLIPDTINKKLANANVYYGVAKVKFGLETSTSSEEFSTKVSNKGSKKSTITAMADSVNNVNYNTINNYNDFDPAVINYLNTSKSVTGAYSSSDTVTFANAWLTAPTGIPATSVNNFTFFINGQFVEPTSILSFTESAGISTLVLNTSTLGFSLESNDVILAIGKFA